MDSPEQRRKRKRFLKPTKLTSLRYFPPLRSLIYSLTFFFTVYFLFRQHTVTIPHVVTLSRLSSLSNYQINPVNIFQNLPQIKIQDTVSFPDHTLLLVSNNINTEITPPHQLQCVYKSYKNNNSDTDITRSVLSVDEYIDNRFLIRCPQSVNYSSLIGLQRRRLVTYTLEHNNNINNINKSLNSWENLAYEALLDENTNTVIIFVKGISHRQGKESDPTRFTCHFGFGDMGFEGKYMLSSLAVSVAQEVVRCVLPRSMVTNPGLARGVRATVSYRMPRVRGRVNRVVVPSVAKMYGLERGPEIEKRELCACTMLWNQAHSLREWITYHSWLGVEKWFIYDNNSDDDVKTVIESLDREGYNVSRRVWPWIKTQEAGFSHCAIRAQTECNWVSFMDVDEFYYFPHNPISGFPSAGALRTLVSNYTTSSSIGEIRTSCHSFGPSGLTSRPKQGVTVGYTCRLQSPERHKSIIRPNALDSTLMNVVHHFYLKKGFTYIDLPQSVAVINHYKYQVWEVFRAKFYRRVATYVADWSDKQNEGSRDRAPGLGTEAIEPAEWRLQFCEVWDTGLRDFVLGNLGDVSTGVLPW